MLHSPRGKAASLCRNYNSLLCGCDVLQASCYDWQKRGVWHLSKVWDEQEWSLFKCLCVNNIDTFDLIRLALCSFPLVQFNLGPCYLRWVIKWTFNNPFSFHSDYICLSVHDYKQWVNQLVKWESQSVSQSVNHSIGMCNHIMLATRSHQPASCCTHQIWSMWQLQKIYWLSLAAWMKLSLVLNLFVLTGSY